MGRGGLREELERLKERLTLTVVHVLEQPPKEWAGEILDAAEAALIKLGVPAKLVHTERFDMV